MVAVESPEWLPPGFTVKIRRKDGRKIKYYFNDATGKKYYSKNEVIHCAIEENNLLVTPQTKNCDNKGPFSINEVDAVSDKANDSSAWLPDGWTVEERKRNRGSVKGSAYKVYTDLSSGRKFYSKAAVTRYLSIKSHADTVTKQIQIESVDEPYPDTSTQVISYTDTNGSHGKKKKNSSFVTVSVETTIPNDMPSGWIKEVRTSKSGSKMRKDSFYIDPVSSYVFCSKPDALRFLKTNDIRSCARKPLKRDLDVIKLNENKIPIESVGEPYPDTCTQVISLTDTNGSRGKKRKNSSFVTVSLETTIPNDLPSGWIKEVRTSKSGSKMRKDSFYTDPVSGYVFCSKLDALRFLRTNDIRSCASKPTKRNLDDIKLNENQIPIESVGEPYPDTSPKAISLTDTNGSHGKKRKNSSFVTVSVETTIPNDLPSGWIKEVRTSKSGSKIRKDPFYIDPVSGYMFCSKPDALRFLKTNDIRSCASKPLKWDLDVIKLNENQIPIESVGEPYPDTSPQVISLTDTNGSRGKKRENSSFVTVSVETTIPNDLPSGWIKEVRTSKSGSKMRKDPFYIDPVSGYMFRSKPDALRFLKTNDIRNCACKPLKKDLDDIKLNENKIPPSNPANEKLSVNKKQRFSGEDPNGLESAGTKSLEEPGSTILKQKQVKKNGPKVKSMDVAIGSPVTDHSKQHLSESGSRNEKGSRKSKKGAGSSLPLRTSKRLGGSDPEMQFNLDLNAPSTRAALKGSPVTKVDTSPSFLLEASDTIPQASNIEKPPSGSSAIPEEPSGEKASKKPVDDGQRAQESELCYDFGYSWSDPLEFALKTLRGETPTEDTLPFPSCFGEQLNTTSLTQSQFVAPINFQNVFASNSDCSKKNNAVEPLPASSPSLSAFGNINFSSFSAFNHQPRSESSEKRNAANPLPASSPSLSKEVGKKASQTKFNL